MTFMHLAPKFFKFKLLQYLKYKKQTIKTKPHLAKTLTTSLKGLKSSKDKPSAQASLGTSVSILLKVFLYILAG